MPWENENVFIAEGQSLNVDEQQKKDILDVIESLLLPTNKNIVLYLLK
ncbi:hypothetical protein [Wolbachia endosymbiont of Phyllotreta cruciferae]|nr:hypothetical protein [Wolbachia endosymbiont of Phyllotreta cruciferae]